MILLDNMSGLNNEQIKRINSIVITQNRRFQRAQVAKVKNVGTYSTIKSYSKRIREAEDSSIQETFLMNFLLDTKGMVANTDYELLQMNDGIISNSIIAEGVDSKDVPTSYLSSYGVFYINEGSLYFRAAQKPNKDLYYVTIRGNYNAQ